LGVRKALSEADTTKNVDECSGKPAGGGEKSHHINQSHRKKEGESLEGKGFGKVKQA